MSFWKLNGFSLVNVTLHDIVYKLFYLLFSTQIERFKCDMIRIFVSCTVLYLSTYLLMFIHVYVML